MINNIYYTLLLFVMKNVSIRLNISSPRRYKSSHLQHDIRSYSAAKLVFFFYTYIYNQEKNAENSKKNVKNNVFCRIKVSFHSILTKVASFFESLLNQRIT